MTTDGNRTGGTLSKEPHDAEGETAGKAPAGDAGMRGGNLDERLALLLDDDLPERDRREVEEMMAAEPDAARAVAEMRAIREALRNAGPAEAPPGFEDAVMARFRKEHERATVVRLQDRRDRRLVLLQAASVAVLVGAYAGLLGTTRIHDVSPRWGNPSAASQPARDAGAMLEPGATGDEATLGAMVPRIADTAAWKEIRRGCSSRERLRSGLGLHQPVDRRKPLERRQDLDQRQRAGPARGPAEAEV